MKQIKVGVLGLQGAFVKHVSILAEIGIPAEVIRYPEQLNSCDGLIIPGGESTTMTKLIDEMNIREKLLVFKRPIFGTCAGAILLSNTNHDPRVRPLNLIPLETIRNAYGRQIESFTCDIKLTFDAAPFKAVFIRAPRFCNTNNRVEILGKLANEAVLVRYQNFLAATFHPELTDDARVHRYFIEQMILKSNGGNNRKTSRI
jgi:5'-phosphate synthase pdxT subunit